MDAPKKESSAKPAEPKAPKAPKKTNWLKISIIANIVLVVVIAAGLVTLGLLHQSDTNPSFCGTCHNVMGPMVESYLTGKTADGITTLDHAHAQANVQCKDCHDYPLPAEIRSGINYIIGNYEVPLATRKFGTTEFCLRCHVSYEKLAERTVNYDPATGRNPHDSHNGELDCMTCHKVHQQSELYCVQCHSDMKIPEGWKASEQ